MGFVRIATAHPSQRRVDTNHMEIVMQHDQFITLEELCSRLGGIGRATAYRHIKNLPGFPRIVKVGAATRFRESDVQRFIRGEAAKGKEGGQL